MYKADSFYTLDPAGRIGLVCLSAVLVVGLLALVWRGARGRPLWLRAALGAGAFAAFVWLSPQVYYQYYHLLFDDLPQQWVVRWPGIGRLLALATFRAEATLSAHGQGVLAWLTMGAALSARPGRDDPSRRSTHPRQR